MISDQRAALKGEFGFGTPSITAVRFGPLDGVVFVSYDLCEIKVKVPLESQTSPRSKTEDERKTHLPVCILQNGEILD